MKIILGDFNAKVGRENIFKPTNGNERTHNQIDHILIYKRWHSSILDVPSFRGADCDTNHYMVVVKVRERFNLRKLNELEVRKQYQVEITNKFATLENLSDNKDINRAWKNIKEKIKTSA